MSTTRARGRAIPTSPVPAPDDLEARIVWIDEQYMSITKELAPA
ncbi:hypothetical protein [Polyangium sp. 6x1]|nr:hypothetical protein [Polyangium sp. 6x1]MDI1448564.1 hypothetical protein [Polyangium sp. 6x1]